MALTHAASGDLVDIRPLGPALPAAKSRTLVQSPSLEIFRMVLPAGKTVAPHRVPGADREWAAKQGSAADRSTHFECDHPRKPRATRHFTKTKPATGAGSD